MKVSSFGKHTNVGDSEAPTKSTFSNPERGSGLLHPGREIGRDMMEWTRADGRGRRWQRLQNVAGNSLDVQQGHGPRGLLPK